MKIIKKVFCKKNIIWFSLALLLIIVIIFFSFRKKVDEYIIEDHELYQYFTGIKVEYTGKIKINKDDDSVVKLSFKEGSVELDSTPIYYKDSEKVLFPKNMAVLYPIVGEQYKINYYSNLYKDQDLYYVKDRSLKRNLVNSVLYDGNDLYFFVDNVNVTIGTNKYNLSPMSYIIVDVYNNRVDIYDKANDKYTSLDNIVDEVLVSTDRYKINASLDLMYYNNKSRLFIKDVEKLKNLEK